MTTHPARYIGRDMKPRRPATRRNRYTPTRPRWLVPLLVTLVTLIITVVITTR